MPPVVLCALDFSDGAAHTLLRAADLAERRGGALHLLHVRPVLPVPSGRAQAFEDRVRAFLTTAFGTDEAFGALAPTLHEVADADAADAIVRTADRIGAETVVVGTHSRSALGRAFLGSVAADTLRRSRVPVLVVPERAAATAPGPEAPVVVGADFSTHTWPALQAALGVRTAFGSRLVVVHVEDVPDPIAVGPTRADDALDNLLELIAVPADRVAVTGRPADALLAAADRVSAGLVVVGTHGRTGWDRLRLGSVAEAVVERATTPVLVVPSLRDRPG